MTSPANSDPASGTTIGWNATSRSWSSAGEDVVDRLPRLDGRLVTSGDELDKAASDLGNLVRVQPLAVLRPGSVDDIARVVGFCAKHGIPVAARGAGHMTHGQALVLDGLVIDMTVLDAIHSIGPDGADVGAGVLWSDLVASAAVLGLRVVNLTGYLKLTVGGTLSAGGISAAYREGAQIDLVRKLQVVTGDGDVVWCSPTERTDLFHAALGGLGQVAVITRAVVDLVPAPEMARVWRLPYLDVDDAFTAMRRLVGRREVDELYCMVLPPGADTPSVYLVHAVSYYSFSVLPQDGVLLRDLPGCVPAEAREQVDLPYLQHAFAIGEVIDGFRADGWDERRKPWFDVFLGNDVIEPFVAEVVPALTEQDWSLPDGGGFVLLFPHLRASFSCPRLRLPDSDVVWLFDILNVAPQAEQGHGFTEAMLSRNDRLWRMARARGGVRYPIGSLTFGVEDWRDHYGETWAEVQSTRERYDPAGILAPGHGIAARG